MFLLHIHPCLFPNPWQPLIFLLSYFLFPKMLHNWNPKTCSLSRSVYSTFLLMNLHSDWSHTGSIAEIFTPLIQVLMKGNLGAHTCIFIYVACNRSGEYLDTLFFPKTEYWLVLSGLPLLCSFHQKDS